MFNFHKRGPWDHNTVYLTSSLELRSTVQWCSSLEVQITVLCDEVPPQNCRSMFKGGVVGLCSNCVLVSELPLGWPGILNCVKMLVQPTKPTVICVLKAYLCPGGPCIHHWWVVSFAFVCVNVLSRYNCGWLFVSCQQDHDPEPEVYFPYYIFVWHDVQLTKLEVFCVCVIFVYLCARSTIQSWVLFVSSIQFSAPGPTRIIAFTSLKRRGLAAPSYLQILWSFFNSYLLFQLTSNPTSSKFFRSIFR